MTPHILLGAVLGFFLPVFAGRFGKILPAEPGVVLLHLGHRPRFPRSGNVRRRRLFYLLWAKLVLWSVAWAGVVGGLFALNALLLPAQGVGMAHLFCLLMCWCIAVDAKYFLLPDFFTFPLLFAGLAAALWLDFLPVEQSVLGVLWGYGLSVLTTFAVGLFYRAEFGAGDVKMIAGLGAWLGIYGLTAALVLSFLIFACIGLIQSRRSNALGPALGAAGIFVFYLMYAK
ncbi:MAG: A24 family peptidase [Alphaproteobacteria bacterium]|nr:A24 family peptidase [Alphaproteobacteria bacterium]